MEGAKLSIILPPFCNPVSEILKVAVSFIILLWHLVKLTEYQVAFDIIRHILYKEM